MHVTKSTKHSLSFDVDKRPYFGVRAKSNRWIEEPFVKKFVILRSIFVVISTNALTIVILAGVVVVNECSVKVWK